MFVIVAGKRCLVYDRLGSLNEGTQHFGSYDPISVVIQREPLSGTGQYDGAQAHEGCRTSINAI